MDNNLFQYNESNIITNPNEKIIYNKNKFKCIDECKTDNNCQGLVISNPICNKNIPLTECINSINDMDILNLQPENLYESKCKFIHNYNNLCKVYKSNEDQTFLKNKHINMLNSQIDLDKYYYLKIGDKYLSIDEKFNNIFLTSSNNVEKASLFKFNSDNNIIEIKTQKCLQINGKYLILSDCNNFANNQKFIYEDKLNSIRPFNNLMEKSILCLSLSNEFNNDDLDSIDTNDNRIILEECKYINKQNIKIEKNTNNFQKMNINENFSTLKQLEKKIENIEFCSNPIYKSIVFIILVGILIYLIWFISRKSYYEEIDYNDKITTPFKL